MQVSKQKTTELFNPYKIHSDTAIVFLLCIISYFFLSKSDQQFYSKKGENRGWVYFWVWDHLIFLFHRFTSTTTGIKVLTNSVNVHIFIYVEL